MKAKEIACRRVPVSDRAFAEIVIWKLPQPLRGCGHVFTYRLAFVVEGRCVVRYDNEMGKGDHRHVGKREFSYEFVDPRSLVGDFMDDVGRWQDENGQA